MNRNLLLLAILFLFVLSACTRAEVPLPTQNGQQPTLSSSDFPILATGTVDLSTKDSTTLQPPANTPPAIDGAELLDSRCSVCHSTSKVTSKTATAAEWEAIVAEMIGRGAVLSDEEKELLVQYLVENFK